ncbi:MAG: hypothetical protein Q9187_001823 [Circinaria calcarea]
MDALEAYLAHKASVRVLRIVKPFRGGDGTPRRESKSDANINTLSQLIPSALSFMTARWKVDMDDEVDMNNNGENALRKKTRSMTKCSACREKKIKCEPEDRDWEGIRQQCDYCIKHGKSCSPNYIKNNDPAVQSTNSSVSAAGDHSRQHHARHPAPVSTIASIAPALPTVSQGLDPAIHPRGPVQYESIHEIWELSDKELEKKAGDKQDQFNQLVVILDIYIAQLDSSQTHGYTNQHPYSELFHFCTQVKEDLHHLFIYIVELGVHADSRAQTYAQSIYLRLLCAWVRHPQLCGDGRKRQALLKMAVFFQKSNQRFEAQHLLATVAMFHQSPGHMLAQSLVETSDEVSRTLGILWEGRHGLGGVPPNLALPPVQRAALHPNSDVVAAVFSNPNNDLLASDIIDQRALHIAAKRGLLSELNRCIQAGIQAGTAIDIRDCYSRTALFLAAGNGRADACRALIEAGADINNRDVCGQTILGVAARGGHLSTVECLVDLSAEVNPVIPYDMSTAPTPLHAAIESGNEELSRFLVNQGASVSVTDIRIPGAKSAIDLAYEKGWSSLGDDMCQRLCMQQQLPYATTAPIWNPHSEGAW